jgi:ATP-dependent Lon protease
MGEKKTYLKKGSNTKLNPSLTSAVINSHINSNGSNDNKGHNIEDTNKFIKCKLDILIDIIKSTYLSTDFCKRYDIFSNNSIGQCVDHLHEIYTYVQEIKIKLPINACDTSRTIEDIQKVFDKLSILFSTHGTYLIKDIYFIVFGVKYNNMCDYNEHDTMQRSKLEILEKYMIPIGFKNIAWVEYDNEMNNQVDKITDTTLNIENYAHIDCFEPSTMYSSIHQSVYGLRVLLRNSADKKSIYVNGIMRDIPHQYLGESEYINARIKEVRNKLYENEEINGIVDRWIESLSLKEIMIYSVNDLQKKFNSIMNDIKYVKINRVNDIVKHFFDMDLSSRRKMLINLLIYNLDNEIQYIAYMLYDLIGSIDSNDGNDNREQIMLYETLPWKLKQYFKETMINTIEYTHDTISQFDENKISLEQQVLLMRSNANIKTRALAKLKEVKSKADDQGNKSKQYLEGLIKVPFGVYRKEPILCKMGDLNDTFKKVRQLVDMKINDKTKYTLYEINKSSESMIKYISENSANECIKKLSSMTKTNLVSVVNVFLDAVTENHKTKPKMIAYLTETLNEAKTNVELSNKIFEVLQMVNPSHLNHKIYNQISTIRKEVVDVKHKMDEIHEILDESIYGHTKAKEQILKIVGQWINGEQNGYCFGFEGSPGVGKTSFAKRGLAKCLQDDKSVIRPMSFIALGGSSNGSTLEGHNYTYVNSTWGKVVDILMESKCMNPIIYIDELDKVSKTEQGREIIGILTHLIDSTQNDEFQDRYFSGIPFDLSKALFIFSYNDPEQIDRVLLDRIHRIKFDNLSWADKIIIVNKFIIPELNEKMGFENTIEFGEDVVKFIIETYTMEPGVRKLKEILFDLFGEINLRLLNFKTSSGKGEELSLPVKITIEDLGTTYLNKYRKVQDMKIHNTPTVGTINGMWANVLGKGGIIPIQSHFCPSAVFLELKLTGMQGDVMKESMTVAKTLAWSLTPESKQKELLKQFDKTKNHGLHIHCPEGATPKDGPSAGGAITISLYSLLNNKPIINTVSMTGETNLQGRITAIGGLDSKILGSIKAGVKTILYPEQNQEDFNDFIEKYADVVDLSDMTFHSVDNIEEAMKYVFE